MSEIDDKLKELYVAQQTIVALQAKLEQERNHREYQVAELMKRAEHAERALEKVSARSAYFENLMRRAEQEVERLKKEHESLCPSPKTQSYPCPHCRIRELEADNAELARLMEKQTTLGLQVAGHLAKERERTKRLEEVVRSDPRSFDPTSEWGLKRAAALREEGEHNPFPRISHVSHKVALREEGRDA